MCSGGNPITLAGFEGSTMDVTNGIKSLAKAITTIRRLTGLPISEI